MTDHQYQELRQAIRDYHDDVKRRLELMEDQGREHHVAIHGIAGDDRVPGLNLSVQELRDIDIATVRQAVSARIAYNRWILLELGGLCISRL